jgi:hypothetical protein
MHKKEPTSSSGAPYADGSTGLLSSAGYTADPKELGPLPALVEGTSVWHLQKRARQFSVQEEASTAASYLLT